MNEQIPWINNAVFYQLYPLGLCGAPPANDFVSEPVNRLEQLIDWIPHIKDLGCNALYLGPVFESDFHGYDTADYFVVDRRLGTNQTLKDYCAKLHQNGIKLVLDTVFNHTGRNFFAFKDLQINRETSCYKDWFCGVDFSRDNAYGDGFSYDGWYDAYNLVKFNLTNPEVKRYLFEVVSFWIDEFQIDGIRLDVAEIMDKQFLRELSAFCRSPKPEIWLMGEVINGDYNEWANADMLDSATNYDAYKGLYSSHNDHNYHEISYTLNRQFGEHGIYKELMLYNFADNHDTTRIASILNNKAHLFQLYTILFTMPGVPSLYYGSEWGLEGVKGEHEDSLLRPVIDAVPDLSSCSLYAEIKHLVRIRQQIEALQNGSYRQLYVTHDHFVFERRNASQVAIIALNAAEEPVALSLIVYLEEDLVFTDALEQDRKFTNTGQTLMIDHIGAFGARILVATID